MHDRRQGTAVAHELDTPFGVSEMQRRQRSPQLIIQPGEIAMLELLSMRERKQRIVQNPAESARVRYDCPTLCRVTLRAAQESDRLRRSEKPGSLRPVNQIPCIEKALVHSLRHRPRQRVVEVEHGMIPYELNVGLRLDHHPLKSHHRSVLDKSYGTDVLITGVSHYGGKNPMTVPRELILRTIDEVYRGPAWHGPSVRAVLRKLSPSIAAHRCAPGRNTPWDLLLHLAYTRHRLLIRLGSSSAGHFPRKLRSSWWPESPARATQAALAADIALLDEYHHRLMEGIRKAPAKNLRRVRPGKKITVAQELLGVAVHDAYHSGQIRLMTLLPRR
jgi:DinB family protein